MVCKIEKDKDGGVWMHECTLKGGCNLPGWMNERVLLFLCLSLRSGHKYIDSKVIQLSRGEEQESKL